MEKDFLSQLISQNEDDLEDGTVDEEGEEEDAEKEDVDSEIEEDDGDDMPTEEE